MELVNHTSIPAEVTCSEIPDAQNRRVRLALIVAKTTFSVPEHSPPVLEVDRPLPIQHAETFTPVGVMPRDTLVVHPEDSGVDVMVLGHAWAPSPTESLDVYLRIDSQRWDLRVTGDRQWIDTTEGCVLSPPTPFERIQMDWTRAFGGTSDMWLDERSVVPYSHPINPLGLGFDGRAAAQALRDRHDFPEGFPKVDEARYVPNLESPRALIRTPEDAPEPYCWAPVPMEVGLRTEASRRFSFAHPTLRQLAIRPGSEVELTHAVGGRPLSFRIPATELEVDYELGGRVGRTSLLPTQLLVLPDERNFALTYQAAFRFVVKSEDEPRSLRLRAA